MAPIRLPTRETTTLWLSHRCLGVALAFLAMGLAPHRAVAWRADHDTLAAFFDPVFDETMERRRVPGAVCVVVGPDGILFAKGYGVEDLERGTPVDPDRTLFRLASISKLATATAVMQLAAQDKLDLDADVNCYVTGFQLPETYREPVTLAHLLTHTAGFDDRFLGISARTEAEAVPLGDYLAQRMPPRVMPPGRVMSYSNHGMALAGHVVECVSGMPFEEYVRKHIFEPLGMDHSSFTLTPELASDLATGYDDRGGTLRPALYDFPQTVPASTFMTTGTDMARFMIALLRLGRYGNARILDQAAAEEMHRQQFTHYPRLPGRTYGLGERFENGLRIIKHDGLIWGFVSRLLLVPEKQFGLFISCTGQNSGLPAVVSSRFFDHFFPVEDEPAGVAALPGFEDRARRLAGFYRHNRHVRSTFLKFGTVAPEFVAEVHVARGEAPGMITLRWMALGSRPWDLMEVEPHFFRRVERRSSSDGTVWSFYDQGRVAFGRAGSDRITHLFIGTSAYERLRWRESRPALLVAAVTTLVVLLSACLGWSLAYVARRVRGSLAQPGGWPRRARFLAGLVCGLELTFVAGLGLYILRINPYEIGYGPPPALVALLVLPLLGAALVIPLPVFAAVAWYRGYWGLSGRIHYTLTTVAALLFLLLLDYWNLLGFRFG